MSNFAACAVIMLAPLFDNFEVGFKHDARDFLRSHRTSSRIFELSEKVATDGYGNYQIIGYSIGVGTAQASFYTSPQLSELNHRLSLIDKIANKKTSVDFLKLGRFHFWSEFPTLPSLGYRLRWSPYSLSLLIEFDCGIAQLKLKI